MLSKGDTGRSFSVGIALNMASSVFPGSCPGNGGLRSRDAREDFYLLRPRHARLVGCSVLLGFGAFAEELLDLTAKTSVVRGAPQRRPLKIVQLALDLVVDHGYFPRGPVLRRLLVSD